MVIEKYVYQSSISYTNFYDSIFDNKYKLENEEDVNNLKQLAVIPNEVNNNKGVNNMENKKTGACSASSC